MGTNYAKFHLKHKKKKPFFCCEIGQTSEQVTQTGYEVSVLGDTQNLAGIVLSDLLHLTLLLGWG